MNLTVRKSEPFLADFDVQYRWYSQQAGGDIARLFLDAVDRTLEKLSRLPDLGRQRHFPQPELYDIRSLSVERPFDDYLIFYRFSQNAVEAWRLMHGARDLSNRLVEPRS